MRRILAIQLNQPGDAILTTPALRWLMDQGHEVHALLQPLGAELLQAMPGLGSVEALPRGSIQLGRDMGRLLRYRKLGFDQAIIFSKCSDRPVLWAALSGAQRRTGLLSASARLFAQLGLINDGRVGANAYPHAAQHHLYIADASPEAIARQKLEYHPPPEQRDWRVRWMRRLGVPQEGYWLVHAASRWPSKYWPMENLVKLLRVLRKRTGRPVLVTCGQDPFEVSFTRELISRAVPDYNEIGTLEVNQLGALIQAAAGFVGVDSMPMHLAAALQKPGVALFGPTDENVWGPWHSRLTVMRQDCRCLREGKRSCPIGPLSLCLEKLSAESVVEALTRSVSPS